jgi:hypothetical protein
VEALPVRANGVDWTHPPTRRVAAAELITGTISKATRSLQFAIHGSKEACVFGLHQLEAAVEVALLDPALEVFEALWQQAAGTARRARVDLL